MMKRKILLICMCGDTTNGGDRHKEQELEK